MATSYTFTIPDTSGEGTLPAIEREGYNLVGWSTSATERQGSGSGPDGLYVAGDTYTVVADDSGNPDYTTHGAGSATLYAVWALEYTYTLNYSCGTGATNCPTTQTTTTINTSHTFTIPSTAPSLDGYNFINYTDNGAGAGNTYDPGDTITLTSSSTTKTLTANFATPDFWNITTMQEMTWDVCQSVHYPNNTTSTNTNYLVTTKAAYDALNITSDNSSPYVPTRTLLDDRDADGTGTKRSYTVSRLADGNCWMTENLKYDLRGLYNNGKRGIGSWNNGTTFEMTDANLGSGVSYYTTSANFDYVITPDTTSANVTRYNAQIGDTSGAEYYYTWTGATAGQGFQSQTSGTIDGSICPAGWRLPTYSGTYSYQTLYNSYNSATKWEQYPATFLRVGYFDSGSQGDASYGDYWSASVYNANYAYSMYYYTSFVNPQYGNDKYLGFSVRCVANR